MQKVALITGGARGIGRATAIEFAQRGYNVVINYHYSREAADQLKAGLENHLGGGSRVLTLQADVSNEIEVLSMVSAIMKEFGRIDVLVNNAGIVFDRDFDQITVEEFKRTLEVNVLGAFLVARAVSKHMQKGGAIVNVSSTNGTKTISPDCLDYNISKVGLQSLTRDLAYQLRPNIRVNAVAIGWADTDMNKDLPADYIAEERAKIYLERFANPSEIAKAIVFLASDDASYINGEILTIDGGY